MWTILDTGVSSAEENMQTDASLLAELDLHPNPILHLYDWEGTCATYGYLTKPADYLDLKKVEEAGVSLARRPTGGGIVFHAWDFAFSVLVPAKHKFFSTNTLDNYAFVNNLVRDVAQEFAKENFAASIIPEDMTPMDDHCKRFCMAQPTKYDVVWQGRKIAGAAQRQTKFGFLHQGTISLMVPDFFLLDQVLLPERKVLDAIKKHTFSLLPQQAKKHDYLEARRLLKKLLISKFSNL